MAGADLGGGGGYKPRAFKAESKRESRLVSSFDERACSKLSVSSDNHYGGVTGGSSAAVLVVGCPDGSVIFSKHHTWVYGPKITKSSETQVATELVRRGTTVVLYSRVLLCNTL